MQRVEPRDLTNKLFRIAVRPHRLHEDPRVVLPEAIQPVAFESVFREKDSFKVLELGTGWGEFALEWLAAHPEHEYLAMEVKYDRVFTMLKKAGRAGIANLKVIPINFNWFLESILPRDVFDLIIINFPDPWPKRRHWKHRLVQTGLPERLAPLLRKSGSIFLATDYGPYARRMLRVFRDSSLFEPIYDFPHYLRRRPDEHPGTRFEEMTMAQGRTPYYQKWRIAAT